MSARKPFVANQSYAALLGVALSLAGGVLLYDAYDRRGKGRPFALRFLPGP